MQMYPHVLERLLLYQGIWHHFMRSTRRNFVKNTMLTGALLPLYGNLSSIFHSNVESRLKIHIFSKHLQFLNYNDLAEAAVEMGFDGIDLTVRPKGHVLPERVETDLP